MTRKKMAAISLEEAMKKASAPGYEVYMLIRVHGDTTFDELMLAEGFYTPGMEGAEEDEPKQKKTGTAKKVDHGRIVALYKANRSIKWIADDMRISISTVTNHLIKEGIYKTRKYEKGENNEKTN